ncbi:MAG: glycosyltransferase, partial [Candidatus Gracilibacteria bacterium]
MNILQINTIDNKGGAAKIAWQLKTNLEKSGNTTSLFVKHRYSDAPNVFVARWPNPFSRLFKKITGKDIGSFISNKIRPFLANDIDFFGSSRILKTKEFKKADVIHCHNLHGNYFKLSILQKMSKLKPVLWTLHDMWAMTPHCYNTDLPVKNNGFFECTDRKTYQEIKWPNEKYLCWKKKNIYEKSKFHVVVPCQWLKEKAEKSVLKNHPISVIYNGIDTKKFKPEDKNIARKKLGLPENSSIILYISPIGQSIQKGWDIAKKISEYFFQKNKEMLFVSIGEKSDGARKNQISVPFIYDEVTLARYYCAADILLFPSPRETLPLTILESLACCPPIV